MKKAVDHARQAPTGYKHGPPLTKAPISGSGPCEPARCPACLRRVEWGCEAMRLPHHSHAHAALRAPQRRPKHRPDFQPQGPAQPAPPANRPGAASSRLYLTQRATKNPSNPPTSASIPGSVRNHPSAVGTKPSGNSPATIGSGVRLTRAACSSPSSRSSEHTA